MEVGDKILKIGIIILIGMLSFSCVNDEDVLPTDRVVLVYMGGDNDLSDDANSKIEALRNGWDKNNRGKLLIYSDPSDDLPQLIEICICDKGNSIKKIIHTYEEENSASAEVLSRVIKEVKEQYPAPSYGLILFSHASGWLPSGTLKNPKSVLVDGKNEMSLADFAKAIPDKSFDFIIFEACFMAGIEVVYELKGKADYILASSAEIVAPGFEEIYKESLSCLYRQEADLKGFTQSAFDYFDSQSGFLRSATFSIIKTTALENLGDYIKDNCEPDKAIDIGAIQYFNRNSSKLFFDFEDYYTSILKSPEQRSGLLKAIAECISYKAATATFMEGYDSFQINKHSGLTTYIGQETFPYLNDEYQKLGWYRKITKLTEEQRK